MSARRAVCLAGRAAWPARAARGAMSRRRGALARVPRVPKPCYCCSLFSTPRNPFVPPLSQGPPPHTHRLAPPPWLPPLLPLSLSLQVAERPACATGHSRCRAARRPPPGACVLFCHPCGGEARPAAVVVTCLPLLCCGGRGGAAGSWARCCSAPRPAAPNITRPSSHSPPCLAGGPAPPARLRKQRAAKSRPAMHAPAGRPPLPAQPSAGHNTTWNSSPPPPPHSTSVACRPLGAAPASSSGALRRPAGRGAPREKPQREGSCTGNPKSPCAPSSASLRPLAQLFRSCPRCSRTPAAAIPPLPPRRQLPRPNGPQPGPTTTASARPRCSATSTRRTTCSTSTRPRGPRGPCCPPRRRCWRGPA